jgi:uncharacterized membrane protein YccC
MNFKMTSSRHVKHALKTALASVSAYALTTLFSLPQGYWAVISVIVVMQTNLGGSVRAGVNRVIGTAVGAAMGLACLYTMGSGSMALGVGVGLTILVCAYFVHLHESFRMAGLTAAIIILMGGQADSYLRIALMRFLEINLGVTVALAFSLLVWPSRAGRHLREGVVRVLGDEAAFYDILFDCRFSPRCDRQNEDTARVRLSVTRANNGALLEEAKQEPSGFSRQEHIIVSLYNFTERLAEHLLSMEHAVHHRELESLHGLVADEMDHLARTTVEAMTRMALAIGQGGDPGPMDDLTRAVDGAEEALSRIRQQKVLPAYELEPVMRFFSYYYNMREVARELTAMRERAALLYGGD